MICGESIKMSDVYMKTFIFDAIKELQACNFFDDYNYYNDDNGIAKVSIIRRRIDTHPFTGERTGTICLEKLMSLETTKRVKEEFYYLMDGYMPELDEHPIGKKLNQLWKLIDKSATWQYKITDIDKFFVDKLRHYIRYQLDKQKYTEEDIIKLKILDYPPNKDNLNNCNRIYKEYISKKKKLELNYEF